MSNYSRPARKGNATALGNLKYPRSNVAFFDEKTAGRQSDYELSLQIVGSSPVMEGLFSVIERVAPTDSAVLITGATGTGKELVARAIHENSLRQKGRFVDINCSAIPETLIEAELFGHQRGTFTGAHENRAGLFEMASGGTLFLDEVDALDLPAQAKLLRVLQNGEVRRIGARENTKVDVRIISATNTDLNRAVLEGRFRSDLLYRLRVVPIYVPELCKRGNDINLLVEYFLEKRADRLGAEPRRFTDEAMDALRNHSWPGNVRELENAIEYALAIGQEKELGVEDLPPDVLDGARDRSLPEFHEILGAYIGGTVTLAEIERRYILSVLEQFGGNQVRAAKALGIDRSKLYRRLKQYGVIAVRFLQEEQLDGMQLRTGQD